MLIALYWVRLRGRAGTDQMNQLEAESTMEKLRPVEVRALPGHRLWLRFADDVEGEVDLSHLVGKGVFALFNDPDAFSTVHIGDSGQLVWNQDVELCSHALYCRVTGKSPGEVFGRPKESEALA